MRRTLAALTEAAAIKKGTALLLGMSMTAVNKALSDKSLSEARYEKARKDFMAASGNLEGVQVNRNEIALEGITPEIAQAIMSFARQVSPAAQAWMGKE